MGHKVTIEKTRASLFEKEESGNPYLIRRMRTAALLKGMRERMAEDAFATPILPPGTVLYEKRGGREAIILQEQPGVRVVRWHDGEQNGDYNLAFPYVILGFGGERGYYHRKTLIFAFYRVEPITSRNDMLFRTNLLNANPVNNALCIGPHLSRGSLCEVAASLREAFWHHAFNQGMGLASYDAHARRTTGDVKQWAAKSKKDPLFALKVRWPNADMTVVELADQLLDGDENDGDPKEEIRTFDDLVDLFEDIQEDKQWAI